MFKQLKLGGWQVGTGVAQGPVQFKIFFPNKNNPAQVDLSHPAATRRPATYGNPRVSRIQVAGNFQHLLGQADWDFANAPDLSTALNQDGVIWSYKTPVDLPAGFYEYKYCVTFDNGTTRKVGDPYARYGGRENQNSALVVGGSMPPQNQIQPVAGGRKHLRDLIVYELMIDDFTDEYRSYKAPIEAVREKLSYLEDLGINAILFMPWTAWPDEHFNWGYNPHQYFSVEFRYANTLNAPAEKLSLLKALINDCHARGMHVIMDGVFNHVGDSRPASDVAYGFPYRWLYQNVLDCPYAGTFGGTFPGLQDLDYHNPCTQEFIRDVCFYWMDDFRIDGIRFDNTVNFHVANDSRGLPQLISDINAHAADANFSTTLEHLDMSAVQVTNTVGATSYWNNEFYARTFEYLWSGQIDAGMMGAIDNHRGLPSDRVATVYLGNHDHAHVAWQAGARTNSGALQWYREQPHAIALLTAPGTPMIQNGQEFAEDYWMMEDDKGSNRRVKPRPLRWGFVGDNIGKSLHDVYRRLIAIRNAHSSLRSENLYPTGWESWQTRFNESGYGIDVARGLLVYHRWGNSPTGQLERFIIVINFSAGPQSLDLPFSDNGRWDDLLNGSSVVVTDYRIAGFQVNSHWGHVFIKR
jgi:1,4-alpha-glucan branching enzyme